MRGFGLGDEGGGSGGGRISAHTRGLRGRAGMDDFSSREWSEVGLRSLSLERSKSAFESRCRAVLMQKSDVELGTAVW